MRRWFMLSLICLALLTQLAIPASEQRLSGDPVVIPSGHLKLKDYLFCGTKPSVPSYMLFGDDGTASWSAASGMAGGCNWERVGTTLVPAVAGDDVEIDGSSLFAGILYVTNDSSGAGIMGSSTDGVGIRGGSTNAVGLEGSSGAANGIEGWTEGAGNTVYSIAAVPDILATTPARTLLGDYADLTDTDDPAWPASGYGRLYIGYGSKLHWLLSDGTDYDLTAGSGGMSSWLAAADWGSDQTITDGYSLNFVGGTGISTTNAPLAQCLTIDLDDTAVTPGSYTYASLTVDQQGRLTAASSGTAPITDHGALGGLADDDHPQYALLAGRTAGQVLIGGTASGKTLELDSTSHANKGGITIGSGDWLAFTGYAVAPTLTTGPGKFGYNTSTKGFYWNQGNTSDNVAYVLGAVGAHAVKVSDTSFTSTSPNPGESVIGTDTIAGSTNATLASSKLIRVTAWGKYSTPVSSPGNLTVRLRWNGVGGTQILTTGANALATSIGARNWEFHADLTVRSLSTANLTVQPNGCFRLATAANADAGWELPSASTVTLDNSASKTLDLTAQFSGTSTGLNITCQQFLVEIIN